MRKAPALAPCSHKFPSGDVCGKKSVTEVANAGRCATHAPRCTEVVFDNFYNYQCGRRGVVSRPSLVKRDGKRLYCKQHDPVAVAAKREARDRVWSEKWRARDEEARKAQLQQQEDKRRLARLDAAIDLLARAEPFVIHLPLSAEINTFLAVEVEARRMYEAQMNKEKK